MSLEPQPVPTDKLCIMFKLSKNSHRFATRLIFIYFEFCLKRWARHSQNPPVETHVCWVMDNRRQAHKSRSRQNSLNFGAKQYTSATTAGLNSASTGITPIDDSYANLSSSYSQSQDLQPFHHPSYTLLHQNSATLRQIQEAMFEWY